jgi:hypothetical protein
MIICVPEVKQSRKIICISGSRRQCFSESLASIAEKRKGIPLEKMKSNGRKSAADDM